MKKKKKNYYMIYKISIRLKKIERYSIDRT